MQEEIGQEEIGQEEIGKDARGGQNGTRGDGLAECLEVEIASGLLTPGYRLDESALATRFGVSRTPVREALRQLEAKGLAERQPYKGVTVSAPNAERLAAIFLAAGEIEANCARLSALTMSAAERNALRRSHDKTLTLVQTGDADEYDKTNTAFHDHIYAGAHNAILEGFARDLRQRLKPYRRAQFHTVDRLSQSFAEHEDIVRAIERGQSEEAAARMRYHLRLIEAAVERLTSP